MASSGSTTPSFWSKNIRPFLSRCSSFSQQCKSLFRIKEPPLPKGDSYDEIAQFLIHSNKATINYYRLVLICGCIGIILATCLFFYDFHMEGKAKWSMIRLCPAFVGSGITAAFSQIELESRKKQLFLKLHELAMKEKHSKDREEIISEYKLWSWEEFKTAFKS